MCDWLIDVLLRIRDKAGLLDPLELNESQRQISRTWKKRNIILKARQLGITTYVAARYLPGCASDILPGDALEIRAPSRHCDCRVIVRAVEITACDLAGGGSQYKITFANEAAQSLAVQTTPATAQELAGIDLLQPANPNWTLPALTFADLVDASSTYVRHGTRSSAGRWVSKCGTAIRVGIRRLVATWRGDSRRTCSRSRDVRACRVTLSASMTARVR